MKSYQVTETIAAGPDEVWAVLGDVEHYPDWDSGSSGRKAGSSRAAS